jgi:hypothetical protein
LRLSPKFWSRERRESLLAMRPGKRVFLIRRRADELSLLNELKLLARPGEA